MPGRFARAGGNAVEVAQGGESGEVLGRLTPNPQLVAGERLVLTSQAREGLKGRGHFHQCLDDLSESDSGNNAYPGLLLLENLSDSGFPLEDNFRGMGPVFGFSGFSWRGKAKLALAWISTVHKSPNTGE